MFGVMVLWVNIGMLRFFVCIVVIVIKGVLMWSFLCFILGCDENKIIEINIVMIMVIIGSVIFSVLFILYFFCVWYDSWFLNWNKLVVFDSRVLNFIWNNVEI